MEKLPKVLRMIIKYTLFGIVFIVALKIGIKALYVHNMPGPKNDAELCILMGINPDIDQECANKRLDDLLYETFPAGVTTREDVHQILGGYVKEIGFIPIGSDHIVDSYYGHGYMVFNFVFDSEGKLLWISAGPD